MTSTRQFFGTDGIRGTFGQEPITPEWVLKLGWAIGKELLNSHHEQILIGKDTRISGYILESALQAGIAAAGANVGLLGPLPTPGIAYLTRTLKAQAGIVISASHNAYPDNGIKIFSADGFKLPDGVEENIEKHLAKPLQVVAPQKLGRAIRIHDAKQRYCEFAISTFPKGMSLQGLKIVIDCANGATYQVAPQVLEYLGADLTVINAKPDGMNINASSGSTHPQALQQTVLAENADLGIAYDGDGDRVIFVDHKGELVDGDELLFILATHQKTPVAGVVGTLMSNLGLELALKQKGIDFLRAKVGDRYVLELLKQNNWVLGGEGSGHIINLNLNTTGDGLVAALQVLAIMVETGKSLQQLKSAMQKMPQVLVNVKIKQRQDPMANPTVQKAVAKAQQHLGENGRVLLRASGTEPLIRVMVEGKSANDISMIADELAQVVAKNLL